jgi:hypothetical protein
MSSSMKINVKTNRGSKARNHNRKRILPRERIGCWVLHMST